MNKNATYSRKNALIDFCRKNQITCVEYSPLCFRLTKQGCSKIDAFPKSQKLFIYDSQRWSEPDNFIKTISAYFLPAKEFVKKEATFSEYFGEQKERFALISYLSAQLGYECKEIVKGTIQLYKAGHVKLDYVLRTSKVLFHDCKEWAEVTNLQNFLQFQFRA